MSHAEPLGKIIDYFLRTEFQQRGSPHIHCLFWVEGAPKIGRDSDQAVCQFIDKYVKALLPSEDDVELHDLVTMLQRHSHSSTCKTSSEKCRFHFPRPPTDSTIIAAPPDNGDLDPTLIRSRKEANAHILKLVQDAVVDNADRSLDEILTDVKVTKTQYMEALQESSSNPTVILQRKPWETCINNYNADLLKIWSANLDVQFVTNAYACAMYILSYVSKGERQMGELLKTASKESAKDDSIRHQMKKLGNVFFTHRELSAQEASYRLLSVPLKRCSRVVVFVNTGLPEERIHILKSLQKLQALPSDSLNIFEVNIIDRYSARPDQLETICLADFATMYRLKGAPETDCHGAYEDAEEDEDNEYLDRSTGKEIRLKNNLGVILKRKIRAILRSPRFSSVKSPERYFHALLMLYFPWRNEEEDLKTDCESYESFFQTVKDTVFENQQKFENNSDELDAAMENIGNLPENIWDELAAGQQQQVYEERQEKKPSEDHEADEYLKDLTILPELGKSSTKEGFSVEYANKQLSTDDYYSLVKSLNAGQRRLFDLILKWCRDKVQAMKTSSTVPAFHTFLTGGAGTGKSHLIRALVSMIERELKPICDSPDKPTVLLTAPTGIAAANIDGMTIHHALSLPVQGNMNEDPPISQERLASLRQSLENLTILVIDEISMVGSRLFSWIHKRLNQIKGVSNPDVVFGGIAILAVGDFYQISPVKQNAVFSTPTDAYQRLNPFHLWKDCFRIVELTEIMRQKGDVEFSNLLNRIRVGHKHINKEDEAVLKSRIRCPSDPDYPHDALHVYATNDLVDEYNAKKLNNLKNTVKVFHAVDSKKDLHTNRVNINCVKADSSVTSGLNATLELAVDARVMLVKNIDVLDRLVNGVQGTVVGFMHQNNDPDRPVVTVLVKFDDDAVGQQHRRNYPNKVPGAVSIFQQETTFFLNQKGAIEVTRKQFPLKLAFATTIHKVQGLSLDKIVVSFERTFKGGQAYVALSRAKNLNGLYLQSFDKNKIIANSNIIDEMCRLRTYMPVKDFLQLLMELPTSIWTKVSHINVKSLLKHKEDLTTYSNLLSSDVLAVTETWLSDKVNTENVKIPGFTFYRRDCQECYRLHSCTTDSCEKCNNKGRVGVYVREELNVTLLPQFTSGKCETLYCYIEKGGQELHLCIVYRPEHVSIAQLHHELSDYLDHVQKKGVPAVILGDFNISYSSINKPSVFHKAFYETHFRQIILEPTHISGSCIDHLYTNISSDMVQHGIIPCYFSDHNAIYCVLPTPGNQTELDRLISLEKATPQQQLFDGDEIKKRTKSAKFTRKSSTLLDSHGIKLAKRPTDSNNNELDVTGTEPANRIYLNEFTLPTSEDCAIVANRLQVTVLHDPIVNHELFDVRYRGYLRNLQQHTCPCLIDATDPDGNCFFRAISKQLLGTEKYHHRIRLAIFNFMESHLNTFVEWHGYGMDGLKNTFLK